MSLNGAIATRLIDDLRNEFQLPIATAQGIVGALAMESGGFNTLQEVQPLIPGSRGGYGYAQWTGVRRRAYEAWAQQAGLDPSSYEANRGYLFEELRGTGGHDGRVLNKLAGVDNAHRAQEIFTNTFLRPGIPHMDARRRWTDQVIGAYGGGGGSSGPFDDPRLQSGVAYATEGQGVNILEALLSPEAMRSGGTSVPMNAEQLLGYMAQNAVAQNRGGQGQQTQQTTQTNQTSITNEAVKAIVAAITQQPKPINAILPGGAHAQEGETSMDLTQLMQAAMLANPHQTVNAIGGESQSVNQILSGALTPAQFVETGVPSNKMPEVPELPIQSMLEQFAALLGRSPESEGEGGSGSGSGGGSSGGSGGSGGTNSEGMAYKRPHKVSLKSRKEGGDKLNEEKYQYEDPPEEDSKSSASSKSRRR